VQDSASAVVRQFLQDNQIPGAVTALGLPGQQPDIRTYGVADLATGRPMTGGDRFKIASLSKPVTAEAILRLVRSGRLDLSARLADLLPNISGSADQRAHRITVRHLLQHSAGWDGAQTFDPFFLTDEAVLALAGLEAHRIQDCSVIADSMLARPLQFEPGSRYAYSNLGYCWLGQILARVHGESYDKAVHALVPGTAAMSLNPSDVTVRHHARPGDDAHLAGRPAVIAAAGGWISDVATYFRFASLPIDPLIPERPPYASHEQYYGLGWRVWPSARNTILTHYGALPGVFSVVIKKQRGPVFVAFFNARPANDEAAFRTLLEAITSHAAWRG
jgi:N-acyl-D-amino-acid deacylase